MGLSHAAQPREHRLTRPARRWGTARRRRFRRAGGFTLIEAALTTVIVSTGVLAILAAQQAYHRKNDWAQRTGTAAMLANEIRELMLSLPTIDPITGKNPVGPAAGQAATTYNDVYDFAGSTGNGTTFSPPINAQRQTIPDMNGWSQVISVQNVLADNVSSTFAQPLGSTPMVRVTVSVLYQGPRDNSPNTITQLTWLAYE